MKEFFLKSDILFGTATAATQIEGGDRNSNWYHWGLKGRIKNNDNSYVSADHYNRYKEDIKLMKDLNQQTYRMSIEWSRIEPEKGVFDENGLKHYRNEIKELIDNNIIPLVTLHHFSCPQWFQNLGGWENEKSPEYFLRFTKKVIEYIGDLVSEYCTINEPNVLATGSYIDGDFPPGKKDDVKAYFRASKNLILAHLKSYKAIHQIRDEKSFKGETKVGIAHHIAYLDINSKNPVVRISRKFMNYSFHTLFEKGMIEGKLCFPLGKGYPEGEGLYCDFGGINYYARHVIEPTINPGLLFGKLTVQKNLAQNRYNDLGWEIYPEGLYKVVQEFYSKYKLPIYITENGIADSDDSRRARFIFDHLEQVNNLIENGIPVERYYHWSLIDNLEWHEGYKPRFGLIEVNYKNQKRTIRNSGLFYKEIVEKNGVTKEMIEKYLCEN